MKLQTLELLERCLLVQSLSVKADDFEEIAPQAVDAKREVREAIAAARKEQP